MESQQQARSSHLGDLVQKFAWACLLRPSSAPGGRLFRPCSHDEEAANDTSKLRGEAGESESFHEATSDMIASSSSPEGRIQALESFIGEIFSTISTLKEAYIQLQSAHSPFDPEKLRLADKAVIAELRSLSELKHSYRHHKGLASAASSSRRDEQVDELRSRLHDLQATVNSKQRAVERLDSLVGCLQRDIEERDVEISKLRDSAQKATTKREKLEKLLKRYERHSQRSSSSNNQQPSSRSKIHPTLEPPTLEVFQNTVQNARDTLVSFVKILVSFMRDAGWELEAAAESIGPGISYAKPGHRRFAFESYACSRLFCGFENENFYISGALSSILDPARHRAECLSQFRDMGAVDASDLLGLTPDCHFGKFCHRKYLQLVHEKMEESFFGGLSEHRAVVLAGGHPRTAFYAAFVRCARAVWRLHRLAFAFEPTVAVFQVQRGTRFDPEFMESAARNVRMRDDDENLRPTVGFTVMPGFRVSGSVVKCRVYLDSMVASD